jgi:ankyrin repeat protein
MFTQLISFTSFKSRDHPRYAEARRALTMNNITELHQMIQADRSIIFVLDEKGQTLLHLAIRWNCYEAALLILLFQGPKNMPDNSGYRPIDLAVSNQGLDISRLLLAAGCDPWRIKLKEFSRLKWEDVNCDIKYLVRTAQIVG